MICTDLIKAIESIAARYEAQQIGIVSDAAVMLEAVTSRYPTLRIAVSEEEKSLDTVQRIWDFLFAHRITRRGLLICIGGGVLTDIGGFAAATYKRGIDYVNVAGQVSDKPFEGVNIVITRYSDGSSTATKRLIK